jgi:hypothetical protein
LILLNLYKAARQTQLIYGTDLQFVRRRTVEFSNCPFAVHADELCIQAFSRDQIAAIEAKYERPSPSAH